MSRIGLVILAVAVAMLFRRSRRHAEPIAPSAADIHVPPAPFATYGH